MNSKSIAGLDWPLLSAELDQEGFAVLPQFLNADEADELAGKLLEVQEDQQLASLASAELGRGEMRRLRGPLPATLSALRSDLYASLAPLADQWDVALGGSGKRFPSALREFLGADGVGGPDHAAGIVSRLGGGDYMALHQTTGGQRDFPIQLVILLSGPGTDFVGGELVLTEQRPRMQSRPMVVPLRKGDAALITVASRPYKGNNGYYRVNLKHAVSRVRSGQRIAVELTFHDLPIGTLDG